MRFCNGSRRFMDNISRFISEFLAKVEQGMSGAGVAAERVRRIAVQASGPLAYCMLHCKTKVLLSILFPQPWPMLNDASDFDKFVLEDGKLHLLQAFNMHKPRSSAS